MLEDKIYTDYVDSMKAKDKDKSQFLSFLRAVLKNKSIELKKSKLDDGEVLAVLQKENKKLAETKDAVKGHAEKLDEVNRQIEIIKGYLPEQISEEQVSQIVDKVISDTGAASIKDMGKVMKAVLEKIAGRADSKIASQIVKQKLSSGQ